jgi:hypothetical protein
MRRTFVVAVLLGALALAPGLASAQEDSGSLEQLVAGTADTKAEHQALAKYYEDQAAGARKLAERHQQMHRAYVGGKGYNTQAFAVHCDKISQQQKEIAKDYDALAKLHHDEAKKAAQ